MSRGIDFSKLQDEPEEPRGPVRRIIMPGMGIDELVTGLKDRFPFYGVLLSAPTATNINGYIRSYWDQLDKMSGEACLLISPIPPEKPTEEMRALLERLIGAEKAAQAWEKYQAAPEQTINDVFTQAAALEVDFNRLPCLVLMADLASDRKLIVRLPNWEANDLTRYFTELFTKIHHHRREVDAPRRLEALNSELGTAFMLKLQAARAARGIHETLANVEWSEVIKSTLGNEAFMTGVFKALFGALGVSVG